MSIRVLCPFLNKVVWFLVVALHEFFVYSGEESLIRELIGEYSHFWLGCLRSRLAFSAALHRGLLGTEASTRGTKEPRNGRGWAPHGVTRPNPAQSSVPTLSLSDGILYRRVLSTSQISSPLAPLKRGVGASLTSPRLSQSPQTNSSSIVLRQTHLPLVLKPPFLFL